jgi:hypothetical protein
VADGIRGVLVCSGDRGIRSHRLSAGDHVMNPETMMEAIIVGVLTTVCIILLWPWDKR